MAQFFYRQHRAISIFENYAFRGHLSKLHPVREEVVLIDELDEGFK